MLFIGVIWHMCRSGPAGLLDVPIPERVAGMCKPVSVCTDKGFTILAIRCDTSEETRMQQVRASKEPESALLSGLAKLVLFPLW